jgi:hypothetical protein
MKVMRHKTSLNNIEGVLEQGTEERCVPKRHKVVIIGVKSGIRWAWHIACMPEKGRG